LRLKLVVPVLLSLCLLGGSCAASPNFDSSLESIVRPYQFSIAGWELKALPEELFSSRGSVTDDEAGVVASYFSLGEQINSLESEVAAANETSDTVPLEAELDGLRAQKAALTDEVEAIIARQIREVLAEQGIYNPLDNSIKLRVGFPPLLFRLEPPPHLLVVSPRERIESISEIELKQEMSVAEMESIEDQVDGLGVSSLVVGLGGISTYPAFVVDDASLPFTINAAAEEWLHAYLVFKPLGFLYLLDVTGVCPNYDIATMNETVVGIVSKEIGDLVVQKYYPGFANTTPPPAEEPKFDFNREMREIRRAVDDHLARGEVSQAEAFMEEKREYLASQGYYIRKLNQAYFAFYGTYGDSPTSISPIGTQLKQLREQSPSIKDFFDTAANMTSPQDLTTHLK
jgi:uncharacterized protein YdcH (DUF465 family)